MSTDSQSRDELRKQLLELVYGLLDDGEAAALHTRIASDPNFAAAHVEAQQFADALAASARLVVPQVELSTQKRSPWRRRIEIRADQNGEAVAPSPSPLAPRPSPLPVEQRITRAMRRTAVIAAAVLAIITIGGYLVTSWPLFGLDEKHVRLAITGPHQLEPGLENLFTVSTASATGRPLAAPIRYTLRAADGNAIVATTAATTDRNGQLTIKLKPTLADAERVRNARLEVALADGDATAPLAASLEIDPAGLATQLSLDKPLYQPGEIVRYRSLTLARFGLTPPSDAIVYFEIHDPSGAVVPNSWKSAIADRGVAGGEFAIPPSLPGGGYTLIGRSKAKLFADEKRTFFIRSYRLPRLRKDLEFTRDSYSPGDRVVADLSVQRSDGGAAAGAKLHAIASVDGHVVAQSDVLVGPTGTARVEINLPAKIEKGDAQLAVVIDDGGNRETIATTIRINLDRVEVNLYPEGGDLVAGLENRVYFCARTPLGKPAHIAGQLIDRQHREVAKLETSYKGTGSFKFTPQAEETYGVVAGKLNVVLTPESLKAVAMPSVLLSTSAGVFGAKEPLAIELQSREDKLPLLVAAYCRGVLIGQQAVTARQGMNRVEIPLAAGAGGVVRVTVFDQSADHGRQPRAIAERLVYRRPERSLTVRVGDHKPRYSPGDPVELSVAVTNERGEPTPTALGVSVAADSLYKLIDDELPSMPTHFYLLGEIERPEDLEKADFYLSDDPKAPAALDLLLGTQGWRRFADKTMSDFVKNGDSKGGDGQSRIAQLAALGSPGGPPMTLDNADVASWAYQADLARHVIARDAKLNSLGHGLLLAAAPVALLFIFMLAWGSIGRLQFWLPTLGTAAASILAATLWSFLPANLGGNADAIINSGTAATAKPSFDDQRFASTLSSSGPSSSQFGLQNSDQDMANLAFFRQSSGIYFEPSDFAEMNTANNSPIAGRRAVAILAGSNSTSVSAGTLALSGNNTYSSGTTIVNTPILAAGQVFNGGLNVNGDGIVGGDASVNGVVPNRDVVAWIELGSAGYYPSPHGFNDRDGEGKGSNSKRIVGGADGILDFGGTRQSQREVGRSNPWAMQWRTRAAQNGPDGFNDRDYEDSPMDSIQYSGSAAVSGVTVGNGHYASSADRRYLRIPVEPMFSSAKDSGWYYRIPPGGGIFVTPQFGNYGSAEKFNFAEGSIANDYSLAVIDGYSQSPAPPAEYRSGEFNASAVFQVREYAHHHDASSSGARADFAETLYWNPLLITGSDGKATIKFDLCDAVAKFRVLVDAHVYDPAAGEGRIGSGSGEVVAALPLSVEPKLPLEVNAGDWIDLPVAVVNDTEAALPVSLAIDVRGPSPFAAGTIAKMVAEQMGTVPFAVEFGSHEMISPTVPKLIEADGANSQDIKLPAGGRSRAYFPLHVTGAVGSAQIEIRGQTGGKVSDAKRQSLTVMPAGYPVAASYGGNLSGDVALTVRVPKDYVPGSLAVRLTAYPSPTSQIEDGLEGILREPNGCFEQTSTANYPNVLALEYLQERKLANPELTRRCKAFLQSGYSRLTSYESKNGGFEWFGGDPGHETLTAYGLMEFHEMARVFPVDTALIERTAKWLLSRRDGKGGFERGSGQYFGFGTKEMNDGYITWALTEVGVTGIDAEIKHAIEIGKRSEDPYIIALAAITALNAHDEAAGRELLDWLVKLQAADGHLEGRESFAYSGGVSLQIEATALAAQAWQKVPAYWGQAEKAIDWIAAHRQSGGGFGSTQGAILALKALVEHARISKKTVTGGELIIKRDGKPIAKQGFAAGQQEAIRIDGLAAKLEPGENHLAISLSDGNRMPYSLDVGYRSYTGSSDPACAVKLSTKLAAPIVKAGETVSLEAELSNTTDKPQPMTVAILGLPAGLEPRAKQLEDLKKAGAIDYYETRPREIICYWRKLDAGQKKPLRLDLVAELPGQYTGPASRAYLYYTAERKQWCEPLKVAITRE